MSPQQVSLVQTSWQQVVPIADTAAGLFYGRLFELDPELRHLFKSDLSEQGRKLTTMLNTVVSKLDSLGDIVPAVQDLGRRHVAYGVEAQHYDTVGAALLWTLGAGLGDAFTPEVKEAWTVAYTTLAGAMKDAAADAV
jgi:hemoglobin-like flavoprotein